MTLKTSNLAKKRNRNFSHNVVLDLNNAMAVDGLAFPHLEKVLKLHFHSFAHGDFSRAQSRESYQVSQKSDLFHVLEKVLF